MAMSFVYPANFRQDENGRWLVTFPDLDFAATDGATMGEAEAEAGDCLDEAVAAIIDDGLPIPAPSRIKEGQRPVALSTQMAAKAALAVAMTEERVNKTDLAKRLSLDVREVRRMCDPHHPTKLPRLEQALSSLHRRLVIGVEAAI